MNLDAAENAAVAAGLVAKFTFSPESGERLLSVSSRSGLGGYLNFVQGGEVYLMVSTFAGNLVEVATAWEKAIAPVLAAARGEVTP